MNKILYLIPGNAQNAFGNKGFLKIAGAARKRGIVPVPVMIDWNRRDKNGFKFFE